MYFDCYLEKNCIFAVPESPGGGMVDTLVSGTSASNGVQVRLLSWAQKREMSNHLFFFRTLLTSCTFPFSYICRMRKYFLESCCTSLEEVRRACLMGASRIELCEKIDLGGVTPSISLTEKVLEVSTVPVNVMIRPRGGNFVYTREELEEMAAQIKAFKSLISNGKFVNGFVFGALTPDRQVDTSATRFLVNVSKENATPQITFHRAFDDVADPQKALEDIIALGCTHLLTSGNREDAFKGRFNIAKLVAQAAGRITIIAGKGIRKSNMELIAEDSKAPQLHGTNLF